MKKGIQPIKYINIKSCLYKDFRSAFSSSLNLLNNNDSCVNQIQNYILLDLLYMKPINGLIKTKERIRQCNLHDEREWRYVPSLDSHKTELPQICRPHEINPKSLLSLSEGLQLYESSWLRFKYNNIKYLIVDNFKNKVKLINFINNLNCSQIEKYNLVSKIIVYEELEKDW
jgi:hypothetical protein